MSYLWNILKITQIEFYRTTKCIYVILTGVFFTWNTQVEELNHSYHSFIDQDTVCDDNSIGNSRGT